MFVLSIVLLASFAFAAEIQEPGEIEIKVRAIVDAISAGDEAKFDVTITNNMRFDDNFKLKFSNDVEWTILTDPLTLKFGTFDLSVGESVNFKVRIRASPSASLGYNIYVIALSAQGAATGVKETVPLTFGYGPQFLTPKEYAALVVASIEVPESVDPRGDMQIKVHLRNRNPLNISGLVVKASSQVVDQEMQVNLAPLEEKDVYFTQELDPFESPKQDTLVIEIIKAETTLVRLEKVFEIISYSEYSTRTEEKKGLLMTTFSIDVVNDGNYWTSDKVRHPTSFIKSLFSHTEPAAKTVRVDGERYLEWTIELGPNERIELKVVENYWPIVIILILIVVAVVLYFVLRSPIIIKKDAIIVATKEGGIAGLKIVLHVKNRSNALVGEVHIVDSIPNIAVVDKEFDVGSVAPEKVVKHAKKGTLLKWNLEDMDAGEERMLSYKVKSRLTILGSFTLPAAVSKFVAKGKQKITYSNRLRITT